jgi:hypothetical protein
MTNLFKVTSESWGAAKANQLLLDATHDLFSTKSRKSNFGEINVDDMRERVISSGAAGEVIFADFAPINRDAWGELITLIFGYCINKKIDLTLDPNFKKWIQDSGNRLNGLINEGAYASYWQRPPTEFLGIIEAGFITGLSDPDHIFKIRYSRNKTSYKNQFDIELIPAIARRSTAGMIAAVEDICSTSFRWLPNKEGSKEDSF